MNDDRTLPYVALVLPAESRQQRRARPARGMPFGWTLYTLMAAAVIALAVFLAVR